MMRMRILSFLVALTVLASWAILGQPTHQATAAEQGFYKEFDLGTVTAIAATTAGTATTGWQAADLAGFQIVCTRNSGTGTMDAAVQRSLDGVNWVNIVTFTQLTGSGSEAKVYADVRAASAQMIGNRLRANWVVGGTASYTCQMTGAAEG